MLCFCFVLIFSFVTEILRIKNGFNSVLNWKSFENAEYCDIKLNVIIYDETLNMSIIGEIQLLLEWLLKSKKIGFVFCWFVA